MTEDSENKTISMLKTMFGGIKGVDKAPLYMRNAEHTAAQELQDAQKTVTEIVQKQRQLKNENKELQQKSEGTWFPQDEDDCVEPEYLDTALNNDEPSPLLVMFLAVLVPDDINTLTEDNIFEPEKIDHFRAKLQAILFDCQCLAQENQTLKSQINNHPEGPDDGPAFN